MEMSIFMTTLKIAIDGPAGSGKSTIAKQIAKLKNITYIDTGAMYRAITLKLLDEGVDFSDTGSIDNILKDIDIELVYDKVLLEGVDVSLAIRTPRVNRKVSDVAVMANVRGRMSGLQRQIAEKQDVIMDGRDIGTHVMPDAQFKFFLTASLEERARRRLLEMNEKGHDVTLEDIIKDLSNRDKIDSEREIAPLRQAEDAILVDTSDLSIEGVVNFILSNLEA